MATPIEAFVTSDGSVFLTQEMADGYEAEFGKKQFINAGIKIINAAKKGDLWSEAPLRELLGIIYDNQDAFITMLTKPEVLR